VALAEGRVARSPLRLMVVVLLAAALVPAVLFVDASGVRSGYPFLEAGPLRAPAIVYYPTYVPPVVSPFGLGGGSTPDESAHLEMTYTLASGGELRIWESTRYGADVKDAVGMVVEEGSLSGSLAVWRNSAKNRSKGWKLPSTRMTSRSTGRRLNCAPTPARRGRKPGRAAFSASPAPM